MSEQKTWAGFVARIVSSDFELSGKSDSSNKTHVGGFADAHLCVSLQTLLARMSSNADKVTFGEFAKYVVEHEKRLEMIFLDLDKNRDGQSTISYFIVK